MDTKIESPQTPAAPSSADAVNAWVENLPKIYETQLQYAPKEMQQQLDLLAQYMPQFTQMQYDQTKELYPYSQGLQEQLAKQASEGMNDEPPAWYTAKYDDYYKSLLGNQAASPIGANAYSQGMMEQNKSWGDYYRNLGLSMTNRVPIQGNVSGQSTNYMGGYTPGAVGQQMGTNYGNYMSGYSKMYGTNADAGMLTGLGGFANQLGYGSSALGSLGGIMSGLGGAMRF
jgi:hypothetical protein